MTTLPWALSFATPWLAAAAVPVGAGVALLTRRGLGRGRPKFAWGAAIARGAAVTAALVAAAQPETTHTTPRSGVVLVAASDARAFDGADRVLRWPGAAPDASGAIEALRASAPAGVPASLVVAWSPHRGDPPALDDAASLVPRGATTSILRPVGASAPRIVLPAPRLIPPASAVEGVEFRVAIDAGETPFSEGSGVFTFDGHDEAVPIPDGARRLMSPVVAARAGTHVVTFRVPTSRDGLPRAAAAASLRIAEPPTALLVSVTGIEPPLAKRLRAQGIRVEIASETACDLAPPVDVVVLGPGAGPRCADDVASRAAAGTGLLVMGGEGARGLTRLRGTALEALLPVDLPAPPQPDTTPPAAQKPPDVPPPSNPDRERPVIDEAERKAQRVALLLVIDQSGSMAGMKIAMAREAAIAAARTLSPDDRVGVIAFDEEMDWIAPFQDAREIAPLVRRVQQLDAGGGTNFYPALKDGFAKIAAQPCGVRHVVLITDGATRAAVFREIVESAAAQGITLSAVSVGDGADTRLLGLLAQWGQGRLYPATDPERLPQVITLDTKRFVHAPRDAAKTRPDAPDITPPPDDPAPAAATETDKPPERPRDPDVAAPRAPHIAAAVPFLAGLSTTTWPNLAHPETIGVRGLGVAPLAWDDGTPALVLGRAASGRCAVLAADAFSVDARELWLWSEGGRAVAQLVRSLAPTRAAEDDAPDVRFVALADGTASAIVAAPGGGLLRLQPAGGGDEIRAVCRPAGDVSIAVLASMPAAGVWVGEFAATDADRSASVATGSAGAPPRDDVALALELSARSGASLVAELPVPRDAPPLEHREDRAPPLLAAAALLLVVDAALRRGVRG